MKTSSFLKRNKCLANGKYIALSEIFSEISLNGACKKITFHIQDHIFEIITVTIIDGLMNVKNLSIKVKLLHIYKNNPTFENVLHFKTTDVT